MTDKRIHSRNELNLYPVHETGRSKEETMQSEVRLKSSSKFLQSRDGLSEA